MAIRTKVIRNSWPQEYVAAFIPADAAEEKDVAILLEWQALLDGGHMPQGWNAETNYSNSSQVTRWHGEAYSYKETVPSSYTAVIKKYGIEHEGRTCEKYVRLQQFANLRENHLAAPWESAATSYKEWFEKNQRLADRKPHVWAARALEFFDIRKHE